MAPFAIMPFTHLHRETYLRRPTPPHQPEGTEDANSGVAELAQRFLSHKATLPTLAGSLILIPGIVILALLPGNPLATQMWGKAAFWGMAVLAMAVVCGVAYLRDKRTEFRLLTTSDPTQLQEQQTCREQVPDLPSDFADLRERLCRGIGGKDAKEWRSKIDSAVFPGSDLKEVTDRWLRTVFTVPDGPLQRALLTAGGGPVNNKLLQPADIGIPLPGERRAPHITPAWYADQIARASKKTGTPKSRMYLGIAAVPVTIGVLVYLEFVAHAPLTTLALATVFGILFLMSTMMWSIGTNPGEGYAWRAMSHYLVVELHASAPHALQSDCLDTDCPVNPDAAQA